MNCTMIARIASRGIKTFSLSNRTRQRRNGFTLMELLIVMAIILILMLMAIPTIGSLKKKGNETSAINSVQTMTKAEIQYESTYPANGFACTLAALGGDPSAGPPSPAAAQILQGDLTSGYKSGYIFTMTCNDKVTINGTDRSTATPSPPFRRPWARPAIAASAATSSGIIKYDPVGGTNCTQNLQ